MQRIFFQLLLLGITFINFSCKQPAKITEEFIVESTNLEHVRHLTRDQDYFKLQLSETGISGLFSDFIVEDGLIYCGTSRSSKLVNIYDLKTGELVFDFIERGGDSTQGLSVEHLLLQNENLWIHDITAGKLFKTSLIKDKHDQITAAADIEIYSQRDAGKNLISPIVYNDILLATSYHIDDCRYLYVKNNTVVKKVGNLPTVKNSKKLADPKATQIPNISYAFKAKIAKSPLEDKIAVFYTKTDRIEFYSKDTLQSTITGPDYFGPIMQVERVADGYSVNDNEKTKLAFVSNSATEKGVYCLYAGEKEDEHYGRRIYYFDWDGNLKKTIILEKSAVSIYYDEKEDIMYSYSDKDKKIYFGKIYN